VSCLRLREMSEKQQVEISFSTPLRIVLEQPCQPYSARITYQTEAFTIQGENMSSTMQVGTYATVSVEWKDKGGNIVAVEMGSVKWASSDPATCQCTVSTGNPQIANLYAPGPIGKVQIHATGDADLGQGVTTVTASVDLEVISGQAVGGDIKFTQSPQQGNPGTAGSGATPKR